MFALLCKNYGWSPEVIGNLTWKQANNYLNHIVLRQGEDKLLKYKKRAKLPDLTPQQKHEQQLRAWRLAEIKARKKK